MGNPDLSPEDRRGLVIFPAPAHDTPSRRKGEWWLVVVALALAGLLIAVAFAIR